MLQIVITLKHADKLNKQKITYHKSFPPSTAGTYSWTAFTDGLDRILDLHVLYLDMYYVHWFVLLSCHHSFQFLILCGRLKLAIRHFFDCTLNICISHSIVHTILFSSKQHQMQ